MFNFYGPVFLLKGMVKLKNVAIVSVIFNFFRVSWPMFTFCLHPPLRVWRLRGYEFYV